MRIKLIGFCTGVGGACAALFGGWDEALKLLVCLMIADYITGLIVALVFKNSPKTKGGGLASLEGFKGLCRKCAILCLVLIAYRLQVATGVAYIRQAVIYGFSANEMISLIENIGLMGVPLPSAVTKAIEILKKGGEADE